LFYGKKRRGRKIERSSPVGRAQNGLLGNPDPSPQDKGSNRRSPARRLEPSLSRTAHAPSFPFSILPPSAVAGVVSPSLSPLPRRAIGRGSGMASLNSEPPAGDAPLGTPRPRPLSCFFCQAVPRCCVDCGRGFGCPAIQLTRCPVPLRIRAQLCDRARFPARRLLTERVAVMVLASYQGSGSLFSR
jgi:hypothetical protein